jgi:hypothetical protein
MPDLLRLPGIRALSAGRPRGRDDAERRQPLVRLCVAGAARCLQIMLIALLAARLVASHLPVARFAVARLAPVLAPCGHG